jgi:hypothetical protein
LDASKCYEAFSGAWTCRDRPSSERCREVDLISAANVNTYLNKLSGLFSWALKEAPIERNPAVGLKVPDPTAWPEPAA